MSVTNIKAAQVDRQIAEIRACDNVQSVYVLHRLDDGAAAVVCVVPYEQQGEPHESDWALVTQPYLMLIETDGRRANGHNCR